MGEMEKKSATRRRNKNIQKIILETVAVTGVISIALVAPNAMKVMRKLKLPISPRQDSAIARARKRLVERGMLAFEQGKLRMTAKGEATFRALNLSEYGARKKQQRWDGRWRLLIFDIPEKKRGLREKVRRTLIAIGFIRLQDSVWVYPYDCEDLVQLLKADFKIGKDILYLIVDELEYDAPYRKSFGLRAL